MPSKAIRSCEYDVARSELTLSFVGGATYVYSLVPPSVFEALMRSGSQGAFVNGNIRDRYPYRRVASPTLLPPNKPVRAKKREALSLREALLRSR